jgi:tripeptidyl-peptidase-2
VSSGTASDAKGTLTEKGKEEEAKARLSVLEDQLKAYEEPPFVFDCAWFHNGTQWVVYLDLNGSGDLQSQGYWTEYHLDPFASTSVGSFGQDSLLNFTLNVYDEGRTLSIVTTSGKMSEKRREREHNTSKGRI